MSDTRDLYGADLTFGGTVVLPSGVKLTGAQVESVQGGESRD